MALRIVTCWFCALAVVASTPQSIPLDKNIFKDSIRAGKPLFVKFFAPWCGHCKNLEPAWNELADKLSGSKVLIAEVDCTVETALCAEQGVRAYPTLIYYEQSSEERYRGSRDTVSLTNFVNSRLNNKRNIFPTLTDETFANYLETNTGIVFVNFFTSWCDKCVELAPIWDELANHFSSRSNIHIVKLDCSVNQKTCQTYGVNTIPTLLLFEAGLVVKKYTGPSTLESLIAFVTDNAEGGSTQTDKANKIAGAVPLTADNISAIISGSVTFVKFYAPWCGHCIQLAPIWDELANDLHTSSSIIVAKVDCTAEEQLCKEHRVRAYPTLVLFKNGGTRSIPYNGSRDIQSLKTFIADNT